MKCTRVKQLLLSDRNQDLVAEEVLPAMKKGRGISTVLAIILSILTRC